MPDLTWNFIECTLLLNETLYSRKQSTVRINANKRSNNDNDSKKEEEEKSL